jgi:hypothetical protein
MGPSLTVASVKRIFLGAVSEQTVFLLHHLHELFTFAALFRIQNHQIGRSSNFKVIKNISKSILLLNQTDSVMLWC